MDISIDTAAVMADLNAIAICSSSPPPSLTRIVYSAADLEARAYVRTRCTQIGLTIRQDGIGNLFARWQGSAPGLPAVASGSHLDAIPDSGRYDGTVGVIGAIEAVRSLQRANFQPRRSIEVLIFAAEKPTRFGIGCLGSRAIAGALRPDQLRAL
ncbi:MAG: M20/M25/M40 family metallo-hydrolase, partial [Oscillochloris sp.]|nr:M20/M25/M40 family metallo-hydrolase [Oscillochloris sp.]